MLTVAEMPEFMRRVERLLSTDERKELIDFLAVSPKSGVIMQGTGGIRKLRWSRQNTGKSGGVRIIYYFHNDQMPLYLLTVFGKSEKDNLSKSDRNELAKLTQMLVQTWETRHE